MRAPRVSPSKATRPANARTIGIKTAEKAQRAAARPAKPKASAVAPVEAGRVPSAYGKKRDRTVAPAEARLFGRRRRGADDVEPLLTFFVMRKLKGRDLRELRGEMESDRFLRRALAQKIIAKAEEDGVDVEAESDTPILDWIRDNWSFILQALKDLVGILTGGGGIPLPV